MRSDSPRTAAKQLTAAMAESMADRPGSGNWIPSMCGPRWSSNSESKPSCSAFCGDACGQGGQLSGDARYLPGVQLLQRRNGHRDQLEICALPTSKRRAPGW